MITRKGDSKDRGGFHLVFLALKGRDEDRDLLNGTNSKNRGLGHEEGGEEREWVSSRGKRRGRD